MTQGY